MHNVLYVTGIISKRIQPDTHTQKTWITISHLGNRLARWLTGSLARLLWHFLQHCSCLGFANRESVREEATRKHDQNSFAQTAHFKQKQLRCRTIEFFTLLELRPKNCPVTAMFISQNDTSDFVYTFLYLHSMVNTHGKCHVSASRMWKRGRNFSAIYKSTYVRFVPTAIQQHAGSIQSKTKKSQ